MFQKEKLEISLGDDVNNILNNTNDTLAQIKTLVDTAKTFLEIIKVFAGGFNSPLILALNFILDKLIELIVSINNSNVSFITMSPENYKKGSTLITLQDIAPLDTSEYNQRIKELENNNIDLNTDNNILRQELEAATEPDVIATLKQAIDLNNSFIKINNEIIATTIKDVEDAIEIHKSKFNFYSLSTVEIIDYLVNTLNLEFVKKNSINPENFPNFSESDVVGGFFIFFRANLNSLKFIQNAANLFNLMNQLFTNTDFQSLLESFTNLDVQEKKNKASNQKVIGDPISELWGVQRVSTLIQIDSVLTQIENSLVAQKMDLSDLIKAFIKYLDQKIDLLDDVIKEIDDIIEKINEMIELSNSIASFETYILNVAPVVNGTKIISDKLKDKSDPNNPYYLGFEFETGQKVTIGDDDTVEIETAEIERRDKRAKDYTVMVGFVGGGVGLELIAYLLGFTDKNLAEILAGQDLEITSDTDKFKKEFGLTKEDLDKAFDI